MPSLYEDVPQPSAGSRKAAAKADSLVRLRVAIPLCLVLAGLALSPAASARTLLPGMIGPDVDSLNIRLQHLSYLPPGPRPTSYDQSTRDAVMAFQKYTRIDQSGNYGPLTRSRLAHSKRPSFHHGGRRAQVDLRRQLVFWVAESGRVQRTVSISTGRRGYETPHGHFHIYRKAMWSWSKPYHVWMAYASYITGGVAFHEGDLSSMVDTHGCIHVPMEFAKDFYHWLRMGTAVVIKGTPPR